METRALRYFQTVAVCGSYSRGSELLRISQPAVSRTVRKLEDELKVVLFERHGHGVTLTDAGKRFLARAQSILRQLEQAKIEATAGDDGPSGSISIAVPPAAGQILIPPLARAFATRFPNVSLNVVGGFSGNIHEWLVRGRVDVACAHDPLPQRGFNFLPLVEEEVFLVGRRDILPPGRRFMRPADLAGIPLIAPSELNASRRMLDRWTAEFRLQLRIAVQVDDHIVTRSLVREGIGATLLTRSGIEAELQRRDIVALPFRPRTSWALALITNAQAQRSEALDALLAEIGRTVPELVNAGKWSGKSLV